MTNVTDGTGLTTQISGLLEWGEGPIGYTPWRTMEQQQVDQFADATDDHQYIHVDPDRARESPFGGTVAHGFLTLSLAAPIVVELIHVTDARTAINYGLDKVRFPAPLRVGSRWRGGVEMLEATETPGGAQIRTRVTVEVEGLEKPVMVAESLMRFLR